MDMIINSGVVIDSYHSSLDSYGGSNTAGHGDVQAAQQITVNSGGIVHGSLFPNDPAGLTPFPTPSSYTNLGNIDIGSDYTFQAGDYLVDTLNVNGTPTIHVQGSVRIWFNNVNLAGTVGAGASRPAQLAFFSRTTAGQLNINGGPTHFVGVIFAPNIPVNLNGTGDYFGACVASRVVFNSTIAVHYDEDLGNGCRLSGGGNAGVARMGGSKAAHSGMPAGLEDKALAAVPNPARNKVTLYYQMEAAGSYRISLVDITGVVVGTLNLGEQPAGAGKAEWDLHAYAAGVYFLVAQEDHGMGFHPTTTFKLALLGE